MFPNEKQRLLLRELEFIMRKLKKDSFSIEYLQFLQHLQVSISISEGGSPCWIFSEAVLWGDCKDGMAIEEKKDISLPISDCEVLKRNDTITSDLDWATKASIVIIEKKISSVLFYAHNCVQVISGEGVAKSIIELAIKEKNEKMERIKLVSGQEISRLHSEQMRFQGLLNKIK